MIETKWEISEYNSTTGLFENPISILAPNNQFNIPLKSTRTIEDIVDGDIVMVKPEKHTKKSMITFNWEFTEKTDIKDIIIAIAALFLVINIKNLGITFRAFD